MLPEARRLPIYVRPMTFERPRSYENRLLAANGVVVKRSSQTMLWRAEPEVMESNLERLGGVRPGHFAAQRDRLPRHSDCGTCEKCTTGLENRYGCSRCSAGEVVRQYSHDGQRVCRRHKRWVGPGADPRRQLQVDSDVVRADKTYVALKRRGVLDANRLAELEDYVERWAIAEKGSAAEAPTRFALAVNIASVVLVPAFSSEARRNEGFSQRYASVASVLEGLVGGPCAILTDAIWTLLRPLPPNAAPGPHDFTVGGTAALSSEHVAELRTCAYPRSVHLHESHYVGSGKSTGRTRTVTTHTTRYACGNGHVFSGSPGKLALDDAGSGCAQCDGSLGLMHPSIAADWDWERNGTRTPYDVRPHDAVRIEWVCGEGHEQRRAVQRRVASGGCTVCSGRVPGDDYNLAAVNPEVAARWHGTRNGTRRPEQFRPKSSDVVWWIFDCGHEFEGSIVSQVKRRQCLVCINQVVTGANSLRSLRPDLVPLFHPTKNGSWTPDNISGVKHGKCWWQCPRCSHEWFGHLSRRTGGACPECDCH